MITDIEKINKIIIGGDVTDLEKEVIRVMLDNGLTLFEIKEFLLQCGHILIAESEQVEILNISMPLQEEKDVMEFFQAVNDLNELLNKKPNPLCTNPLHEHFIKKE